MKQHITPKQLNELSDKGKTKLRKWAIKNIHHDTPYTNLVKLPLLSIGQMIEFLGDKTEDINYVDDYFNHQIGYSHTYGSIDEKKDGPAYTVAWNGKELADALWEACKEVLEIDKNK